MKRSKYGNTACWYKGRRFASIVQRDRYVFLESKQAEGVIHGLEMEVPFDLFGTTGEVIAVYRADHVFHIDGRRIVEDVKGTRKDKKTGKVAPFYTPEFSIKRRMFEAQYGQRISIVTKLNLTSLPLH